MLLLIFMLMKFVVVTVRVLSLSFSRRVQCTSQPQVLLKVTRVGGVVVFIPREVDKLI